MGAADTQKPPRLRAPRQAGEENGPLNGGNGGGRGARIAAAHRAHDRRRAELRDEAPGARRPLRWHLRLEAARRQAPAVRTLRPEQQAHRLRSKIQSLIRRGHRKRCSHDAANQRREARDETRPMFPLLAAGSMKAASPGRRARPDWATAARPGARRRGAVRGQNEFWKCALSWKAKRLFESRRAVAKALEPKCDGCRNHHVPAHYAR